MLFQDFDAFTLNLLQDRRERLQSVSNAQRREHVRQIVERASEVAGRPKPNWDGLSWRLSPIPLLSEEELQQLEQVYRLILSTGGTGRSYAEEWLLEHFLLSASESSIPFLLELCDYARPRDSYAKERQRNAVKVLVAVATLNQSARADEALLQLLHHPKEAVRRAAVTYGGGRFWMQDQPTPERWIESLRRLLQEDSSDVVRAAAAYLLWELDEPVEFDPNLAYACKVKFNYAKSIYRTILIPAAATLEGLQVAIQNALGWDFDHLYAFFMDGQSWNREYAFWSPDCEEGPFADEVQLGQLGLRSKQKFFYLFDFGDNHEFEVEVMDVRDVEPGARYPQVIDQGGEVPEQYPRWDEDEWDEDGEEWDEDEAVP